MEEFLNLDALVNDEVYQDAMVHQSNLDAQNAAVDSSAEYQNLDDNTLQ